MEKAYYRIEWDFLWQTLQAFGFPHSWIQWIKECVTNVFYSIKVNGQPFMWFRPSRGLRQGHLLSPYLFILCMEVFVQKLNISSQNRYCGIGFKLQPRTTNTPCILFAYDNLLFYRATQSACRNLKSVLDNLCNLFGQLINFHKSSVVFSKQVSNNRKISLARQFNMTPNTSLG